MKTKNFLGLTFLSLTIILCLMPKLSSAQQNTVKFNLLPLIGKTFSFEYERMVAPKMSVNASVGFRAKSSLPFKKYFDDLIEIGRASCRERVWIAERAVPVEVGAV